MNLNAPIRLALICSALCAWVGCEQATPSEEARETPPVDQADPPQPEPPAPEPVVLLADGLDGWEPINFGGEGEVSFKDGVVNLDFGGPMTGLKYTGDITGLFGEGLENYEITLDAKRVQGLDMFLGLTFPVGKDGHVSLVLGGWAGAITGLSSLDGMNASENATTKYKTFEQKQWYAVRVRVTPGKIECWLDDEQIVDVDRADYMEYDVHGMVQSSVPFAFFTYESWGAYRDVKVTRID